MSTVVQALGPLLVIGAVFAFTLLAIRRLRQRRHAPGSAAIGTVYELLNEDKRKAVEIIIEQKAEATDPETKDGDLPQLEGPKR